MTVEELAMELITHSDQEPTCISVEEAEHIISLLDKSNPLPDNLTPIALQKEWNYIILFDLPKDLWN